MEDIKWIIRALCILILFIIVPFVPTIWLILWAFNYKFNGADDYLMAGLFGILPSVVLWMFIGNMLLGW